MFRAFILALGSILILGNWSVTEAKPGGGHGGGHGRGNSVSARASARAFDTSVRGDARFTESFPRGNAWGLRRRLGQNVTRTSRGSLSNPIDGQTIRRAGRTWEFDRDLDAWVMQD